MNRPVDLHVHSYFSDGTCSPEQLAAMAASSGLSAFALTDHDTVAGVPRALEAGKAAGVEVIPGIEFSAIFPYDNKEKDVHIVGLFLDHRDSLLLATIDKYAAARRARNEKICARFTQIGIPMTLKTLEDHFPGAILTRAHFSRYLMDNGYVSSVKEGFDRYVNEGAPCYVPKADIAPEEAVSVILHAGGVPVLAHPILYHLGNDGLRSLIERLKACGLVGIEAVYSTYTEEESLYIRSLAREYDLLPSGGSDFHGTNKPLIKMGIGMGRLHVPADICEALRKKAAAQMKKGD